MREFDADAFKKLIEDEFNFRKPKGRTLDAKLISDYWGALKDLPIEIVRSGFLRHRKAGRGFPIPADIRPKDQRGNATAGNVDAAQGKNENHIRGYWRSIIVAEIRHCLDIRFRSDGVEILRSLMLAHPRLPEAIRQLIDELEGQESQSGRTDGMQQGMQRRAGEIARYYAHDARAEAKRRDSINIKPERTAALPLSSETAAGAGEPIT